MFTTSHLANEVYPDLQGGKVEESINQSSAFNNKDDDSLFSSKRKKIKDQQRLLLNQTGINHSNKTSLSYEEIKEKASSRTFKFCPISPCKTSSIGKLIAISSIKDVLNRPKNSRHIKMLNELNLSAPGTNEPVLFESKVTKWNSSTNKKFSNNYLVLTRKCLFHFKSPEESAKIFDGIPLCTLPPKSKDNNNLLDSSGGVPIEYIILTLATVFSITEYLTPEPTIRLDYVSSQKKQSFITIVAPDLQKHRQWLISLRSAVRNSNSIGPHLTSQQRTWLTQKLISMDDLDDLTEENEENLKLYRVLLKSFTNEKNSDGNYEKEKCLPVSLVLGKNNIYFIPINLINADEKYRMNKELSINNLVFIDEIKLKQVDIKKYQYPLLCLTNIRSDRHDDTFQLTFINNNSLTKKILTLSSLLFEIIINEIKSTIDSIIYWYPNPSYQMQILSSPTSFPSLLSPLFSPILQPTKSSSPLTSLNDFNGRNKTQMIGLERMIEAQCHAFRTSKARISFNVEYVIGTKNDDDYTNFELLAIINSLKYHPLLYEVIFRNINLSKLQIESTTTGKKMLPLAIYELLVTNPKLRKLDLTFCGITEETVIAIGDALSTGKSSLERLIISNNCITKEGAQALARGISAHGLGIKELDISSCELTHDSLMFILNALDTNNIGELESLNLSNNSCELDLNILSDILSKTVSLRTLNLRNCDKMITGLKKSIQFEDLNLTTLDIGGIPLNSKEQLRSLYSYIQSTSFSKIKYFSVDHCNLDGHVLAIILSYISSSPNYEKIRVWAGGNHITRTSDGCKEFCNAVRNDWTPVWLSLNNTIFGSNIELVENILTSFYENSVLEFLDLSHPQFNDIFRGNKSIKELILLGDAEQRWGQSLGIQLLELENNNVLERLNVKGNGINNIGAKCLSEALKSNTTLKLLNMDENEIGIEGYTSIYNVISTHENTTLQELVYPIHDMQIYIESLEEKFPSPTSRDNLFSSQSIKSNHRISIEKKKIEFKNVVGKIMLEIEEHLKNNEINTNNIKNNGEVNIMDEEDNEEIEVGHLDSD
ncbi:3316_t:CDS:2 [Diversispora eburnea]|uniref:3316_t:CDS:1 n=1 Tax=Diversispora eburnea TaxID=1213867 RepID=A0A9N8VXC5_9GLOM|nr:3316_t:CDS:2 [Diversispora eburnea]